MRKAVVKSASRTLDVLELFSTARRPLRLNQIYTLLHYPQSSTTNLLKSMVTKGYLNYNRSMRTYLPTNRVAQLGNWLYGFASGRSEYQPLLQELQRETDETVALSTQNDLFVQYIRIITPKHEFKMPPNEGAMRVLTDSSSGFAMMSRMRDAEIDKFCRYINYYQLDPHRHVDSVKIIAQISTARKLGYVYFHGHPVPDTSSIALPLGQQLHGIPMAIGVGGFRDRIEAKKQLIVDALRGVAVRFNSLAELTVDDSLPTESENAHAAAAGAATAIGTTR
jgi:DNA-binding IclR family transcriptional regulator